MKSVFALFAFFISITAFAAPVTVKCTYRSDFPIVFPITMTHAEFRFSNSAKPTQAQASFSFTSEESGFNFSGTGTFTIEDGAWTLNFPLNGTQGFDRIEFVMDKPQAEGGGIGYLYSRTGDPTKPSGAGFMNCAASL